MQYDKGVQYISEWTQLAIPVFESNYVTLLPIGFLDLVYFINYYVNNIEPHIGLMINKVSIEKGLLRLHQFGGNADQQEIFKILAQHVAVKSSLTCMVCGKRGHRRKVLEGWPSLCTTHHVQYVNYLDETNHG